MDLLRDTVISYLPNRPRLTRDKHDLCWCEDARLLD